MGEHIDLIVGLGNPDPAHLMTRHNAGFWFVDALAQACGARFTGNAKLGGDTADAEIGSQRVRLLKPMTYMNHSGRAVAATTRYFKIPIGKTLVVHDELDLPPGRAKLKFAGGHAGHNGMRSIIEHCGADFWRLRIGIGHPGPGQRDRVVGYVLQRAAAEDEELILTSVAHAVDAMPALVELGPEKAKNALHGRKDGAGGAEPEPDGRA